MPFSLCDHTSVAPPGKGSPLCRLREASKIDLGFLASMAQGISARPIIVTTQKETEMRGNASRTFLITVAILAFTSAVMTAGNTTKVVIRKLLATPTSMTGEALPSATLSKWHVTMVDDEPTYSVIQLDSASVDGLRADLGTSVANFEPRPDFDVLAFSSYPIDVTASAPAYPEAYTRTKALPSPLRDQFLIQFASLPRPEWFAAFKAAGCTPIDYVPNNGYTLLCDSAPLRSIAANLPTQYIGLQQPIHKISEPLRSETADFVNTVVVVMNVPEAQDVLPVLNEATYGELQPPDASGDRTVYRVTLPRGRLTSARRVSGRHFA
jgi:hypothetical protein